MARTIKDASLDSRAARERLKPRGKPYYRAIEPGLHLGYRKVKGRPGQQVAGTWVVRRYSGQQAYTVERIGVADDFADADGAAVLSFKQGQDEARRRHSAAAKATKTPAGPLTVRTAVEEYLAFLEDNRKSARDSRYKAEASILPALGDIEIGALTTASIRKWHRDLAKVPPRLRTKPGQEQRHREVDDSDEAKRRRRSTANRILTVLKAALNHQFNEGHVTSDVEWRRVAPFESVDAARVRYLSLAESQRLINAAEQDFRPLIKAALMSGARYGELTRLLVEDFNPDSETLLIRKSKSGKARHIELTAEGAAFFKRTTMVRAAELAKHHAEQATQRGQEPPLDGDGPVLLFAHEDGAAWGKSHQARPMQGACTAAKITPRISFHGLRHTWASHAVMNGVPLLVVAKNLGHSDTRMVEKHYGHLAPSYIRDAIRKGAPQFGLSDDDTDVAMKRRCESA
jgi:integrase